MKTPKVDHFSSKLLALLPLAAALIYFYSNPRPQNYYDYTYRVAGRLIRGGVGFVDQQPSWLNEFVPFDGFYYSVFPLGAVISMIPAALLGNFGIVSEMPGAWIAAVLGGAICFFLLKIASRYEVSTTRGVLQTLGIIFGTFMWTNLTFAGAWQLALGFAMLGELGAIYFTVFDRRPIIAGIFFAMAFGNRTEILLTAPVFMFLLVRSNYGNYEHRTESRFQISSFRLLIPDLGKFCSVPVVLGVATLVYNYVRFHSFTDFGYSRIPGVLEEPWYNEGIFSLSYLPRQAWEMLFKSWESWSKFPYLGPNGFSATIIWSSPFLLFLLRAEIPRWLGNGYKWLRVRFRQNNVHSVPSLYSLFSFRSLKRDNTLKYTSWVAILILTILLWAHGNSGGWQFGYRYAMVLLPWVFIILLEMAPKRITLLEGTAYGFSFVANTYATWLYHWTEFMKP